MRRTVILAPELIGGEALRQSLPTLQTMAERGTPFKIPPPPDLETPEALWLGLKPLEGQLRQGPLTVAALGADPPERSTHFHLSPMSFGPAGAASLKHEISSEDQRIVFEQAKRLNARALTIVEGQDRDHGLVWEQWGDLGTSPPDKVDGKPIQGFLPEGDGETLLRRFVDDSINLLSELPLNQEREEEGLAPINLLWPWGQGVRKPVPNLALRRGERAVVLSGSLRLAGLARLAGYQHGERGAFGKGLNTRLREIGEQAAQTTLTLIVVEAAQDLRDGERFEELAWFARELEARLLSPLFERALVEPGRIDLLAPGKEQGLGLTFRTGDRNAGAIPFDERAFEEKSLPVLELWDAVANGLA